jgi:hypothetical protein
MRPFAYSRPNDVAGAIALASREAGVRFLGGGTNLVDLMNMGVEHPAHLIDIGRLRPTVTNARLVRDAPPFTDTTGFKRSSAPGIAALPRIRATWP